MPLSSEERILECLSGYFSKRHPSLALGRGDDCALLENTPRLCTSSDLFLEDVHFRRAYFTPEDVGYKALAVNISDLAACGARPLAFSLCLGLPPDISMSWLEAFFSGMSVLADAHNMALAGGDLSRCRSLHISITVWGQCGDGFLKRGTSLPGDAIFLIGAVGLARIGLSMLETLGRKALEDWPAACAAHLRPKVRTEAGLALAKAARPPSLMDVSDGLARDLPRLLHADNRHFGADIALPEDSLHPELLRYAGMYAKNPAQEAVIGGEDYALLGSCPQETLRALSIPGLCRIGTVTETSEIVCNGNSLESIGFDHFASQLPTSESRSGTQ